MDDLTAVLPRPRAYVHHVVGGPNGLLVVLHHDHRVAKVPEALQRLDETTVVPLVEADGRLVQHVQHPDEAAADLGCEADALCLPTGQGGRRPGQAEVVEAHVQQEAQPSVDLLQDLFGNG